MKWRLKVEFWFQLLGRLSLSGWLPWASDMAINELLVAAENH